MKRAGKQQQTEHYLSIVGYVSKRPPHVARIVHELATAVLNRLGDHPAYVYAIRESESTIPDPRWNRSCENNEGIDIDSDSLGVHIAGNALLSIPDDAEDIGVVSEHPGHPQDAPHSLFSIVFDNHTDFGSDEALRAFQTTVNLSLLPRRGAFEKAARLCVDFFSVLDAEASCYYGLVDVAPFAGTQGGTYYSSLHIHPWPYERMVNHIYWSDLKEKRLERVRGIYWGNYLGPALAAKIRQTGLLDRYPQYTRNVPKGNSTKIIVEYSNGGVFLAASESPMDVIDDPVVPQWPCVANAAWLQEEFRKAGIW